MSRFASALNVQEFRALLCADPASLRGWIERTRCDRSILCLVTIVLGAGLYGAVMGWWRHPRQALFTALKFPFVILLTTLGNSLLNAMLAPLLGLNVTLRQSLMVILMTFTIATVLLGAFSPLALFVVWNTPPLAATTALRSPEYGFLQLTHVTFIAIAGGTGNACLLPLLRQWSGSASVARHVLLAWLAVNLLLGSQICWLLRPFIWDPARPVEFLGPDYFRGSFYETVFDAAKRLLSS
jgi:hypothetical protein